MRISRFQNVYDQHLDVIGQNLVKFLSVAVVFELINSNHLRELRGFTILYARQKRMTAGTNNRNLRATEE